MSSFGYFPDRDYDMQDGIERHLWYKQEHTKAGWIIHVKGTGTEDEEAVVLHGTMGFHLKDDTNAEVFLLSGSSDTTQKYAYPTIPRDKQRPWKENTGGVQSPVDPKRAVEINEKRTYADDTKFATRGGVLDVDGDTVIIRGNLHVSGDLIVNGSIHCGGAMLTTEPSGPDSSPVPGFEE